MRRFISGTSHPFVGREMDDNDHCADDQFPHEHDMTTTSAPPGSPEPAAAPHPDVAEDAELVEPLPHEEDEDEDEDGRSFLSHFGSFAKELFIVVVAAIVVATLLRMFVGQMFLIPSPSMQSTLMVGDRVVAQKISDVGRGDVIVFGDPGGWLRNQRTPERGPLGKAAQFIGVLPDRTKGDLVKRVIGMPGDKVVCCDRTGKISVNGHVLDESSYLNRDLSGKMVAPSAVKFAVVVPAGHLFVAGDNRPESADSRCHLSDVWPGQPKGSVAFVPEKLVVGPAFAVVAPFNHAKRMHRPDIFAAVPAATGTPPAVASISPASVIC
jgi:signal peptidase I